MGKNYLILIFLFLDVTVSAQPTVGFSPLITGLTAPVDIVHAGDGSNRLFIVQQNGLVRLYAGGALQSTPFLNMSGLISYTSGGEQGLLSLAFHPGYATNGYFFVYYNNTAGSVELARYQVSTTDPNAADPASRQVLLTIPKPFTNHNGGKLLFGTDGNLYFGTGDGGSGGDPSNNAQNLNSLLGKMIRINVDNFTTAPYYTVPPGNPLVGIANTRPELYSWGLRNPWRWSFDRLNGDMWIADVGQGAFEEVNRIPAGATSGLNYGWRCYEGNSAYDLSQCGPTPAAGKTFPIFTYQHNAAGGYSITGGLVYRGTEYPALQGYYICADYVNPNGWLITADGNGGWSVTRQTNFPANTATFGDAEDGTLYSASLTGTVYKVTGPLVPLPVKLLSFGAETRQDKDVLQWETAADRSLTGFEVERSTDGRTFAAVGRLAADAGSNMYRFSAPALPAQRFYRLKLLYNNNGYDYSNVLGLKAAGMATPLTAIALSPGQWRLTTGAPISGAILLDLQGRKLQAYEPLGAGVHYLSTGNVPPGTYFLQCTRQDNTVAYLRLDLL